MRAAWGCHFWRDLASERFNDLSLLWTHVPHKLSAAVAVCCGRDGALGCCWWPTRKVQTRCRWADFRTLQPFAKAKAKKRDLLEMGKGKG